MSNEYKKRARKGYNDGEYLKTQSNRSERNYEQVDINESINEGKPVGTKKKQKLSRLDSSIKSKIDSFRRALKMWGSKENIVKEMSIRKHDEWYRDWLNRHLSVWDINIKFLKNNLDNPDVSKNIKKQMVEILRELEE